jgi:hypothetical protein
LIPIPHHQCGFRAYNFTVQQCLRIFWHRFLRP